MKKKSLNAILITILLIGTFTIVFFRPMTIPSIVGTGDFRPYWISSFIFAHGQDFADFTKVDDLERKLTGWTQPFTMIAWFSPIGNLILLPYTFLSFTQATHFWLLTNIVILFFSALMIWGDATKHKWIPIVVTFSFSMTLVSIFVGQVNTLELLGLALFLYFMNLKHEFTAGFCLVLTTIKPHLVILTLPLLLLDSIQRKQWRMLGGFVSALIVCSIILFFIYPAWIFSFFKIITTGMETVRATPNINGLLVLAGAQDLGKWVWIITLPLALMIKWKFGLDLDRRSIIDVSILTGLLVAPIGWSYDQIMLLFPILSILKWIAHGLLAKQVAYMISAGLILANAFSFYQRLFLEFSELWYFWILMVVAIFYWLARWNVRVNSLATGKPDTSFRAR